MPKELGKLFGLVVAIALAYDGALNEWRLLKSVADRLRELG